MDAWTVIFIQLLIDSGFFQVMCDAVKTWVSTKDSLPEESVPVLIYANGHRVTAYYDKVKEIFRLTEDENMYYLADCVTHWMPLPEPPESEAQNDDKLFSKEDYE